MAVAALALLAVPPANAVSLTIAASSADGRGTSLAPGIACTDGGTGANWHYDYTAALPSGRFSALPSELGLHLNLHAEPDALTPLPSYSNAFLLGDQSEVWLSNARGAVQLALRAGSGTCADKPLAFDGVTATGTGLWALVKGTGAYREATGAGAFDLMAAVGPGADNPFELDLSGGIEVLQPSLRAATAAAAWGNSKLDYLARIVTVTYRVTNPGPGDAYGVRVTGVTSPTRGVTSLFRGSRHLGDLPAGESETFSAQYRLGNDACTLVVVNCAFSSALSFSLTDALDTVVPPPTSTVRVTAPVLPL